jgi:glycosyltransferase involved in cell wall biosynthesis
LSIPEVSVIIPTRNRCRQLELALSSALGQRDVDLEVLVVDDCSTDATEELVSSTTDDRVRYLNQDRPAGVSTARNRGIAEAKGRWIAFLDDDDLWAPTKLARQIGVMREGGRTWSYGGEIIVDEELNILGGSPPPPPEEVMRLLERHNAVPAGASNVVVRADTVAVAGAFDPELANNEDWDMWIRLARLGPPDWVRSPLVAISIHRHNASRNMPRMIQELDIVGKRYGIRVDRIRHYRWAAWHSLLEGRRAEATRYYARAVAAGDVTSIARAAVAALAPAYAIERMRPGTRATGADPWITEGRAWLDALTEPARGPCA